MNKRQRDRLLSEIAWRFLRGRRSQLLDGAARSALAATALGVAAMVIAMALMTGYSDALHKKLTQDRIAVMAYPLSSSAFDLARGTRDELIDIEGVEDVRLVSYGQGSLRSEMRPAGTDVTLRGVDQITALKGLGRVEYFSGGQVSSRRNDAAPVVAGSDLAARVSAREGEVMRLLALGARNGRPRFSYKSVEIVGTFTSGLSEFDQKLVVLDRQVLEDLIGAAVGEMIFEILVEDVDRTTVVSEEVREIVGPDYLVLDWPELNRELFTALEVQKLALFLLLGLIVVVSTFNVASSLLVLVRERTRDIGVLGAIGLSPSSLKRLFLLYGGGLSLGGVVVGIASGSVTAWLLTRFELIRFDSELAEIYFLSSVPLQVKMVDLAAIALFTLAVTVLACWLPARRLGRIQPATALRAE